MKEIAVLIGDVGSTKSDWAALTPQGEKILAPAMPGLNALIASEIDIENSLRVVSTYFGTPDSVVCVFYYGAGCATDEICKKVERIATRIWNHADTHCASDLLAAARALHSDSKGIACILGTGSNSALYDGERIISNIPPLGYILGDEGSGTALGKRLISEMFKGNPPEEIKKDFFAGEEKSMAEILRKTYKEPMANKFLASFVPFIRKHIDSPFIHNMVVEEFRKFFRRNVKNYPDARSYHPAFIGGVAYNFDTQLREAAQLEGFEVSHILKAPMEGLLDYHLNRLLK